MKPGSVSKSPRRVDLKKWLWRQYSALPPERRGAPVYVAVSGGLDSSVLAALSLELRDQLPSLTWMHVNYRLRRPDSDREEALLRDWARREGVPLRVKRFPAAQKKPANLQAWARERRLAFFQATIEQRSAGNGVLWMAHHQRDQAETVLVRLLRGAGLRGLGAMTGLERIGELWVFRPLLEVPHEALQVYARAHHLPYRHDASNDRPLYLRNRIRHRILPLLLEENPRLLEVLSELARRSSEAAEALTALARDWLQAKSRKGRPPRRLPSSGLREQPRALRAAILEAWLERLAGPGQSLGQVLPQLLDGIETAQKSFSLPLKAGFRVTISPQGLALGRVRARPNFGAHPRRVSPKKP